MSDRVRLTGSDKGKTAAQLLPYGVAIASVALALGLTLMLGSLLRPTPLQLFYVAVMVSAWYGGLGSGLLATVLSMLAVDYFFIEPIYSLRIANAETLVGLSTFLIAAGLISSLNQARRSALKRAQISLQTLKEARLREQKAQAETQALKEQLETVLSSINDGFYVLDRNWCYTYVNDRLCEMAGMLRSAMLGQNIWELFPDAVDTDIYAQFQQAMSSQMPTQFENFYPTWNRWYENRIYFSPAGLTVLVTDISEAKRTEAEGKRAVAEARNQLQLLETVANYLPNSVAIVRGRDLTFQFVNPMYQALAPGREMVGRTVQEVWPETQPLFADRCRQVLETGEPYHAVDEAFEMSRTGDGLFEPAYFSWSMHRVNLPDENGWGILITIWETTDRKRVEAALRQSEAQSQNILESIDDGFFALDENWRFTYVNRSAEGLLDRAASDLVGKVFWEEFPGLNGSEFERIHRRVASEGVALSHTDFYPDHDRWYEVRSYAAANGITIYFRNVTDRIQAEVALRESEARFRQMADTAPVLIWMSGTDKLCNYFNQPWLDFTGRTIEQEMGYGWAEGVHADDFDRCLDTYVTAFGARQPFQMEYRFRRFDGVHRWIVDSAVPRFTSAGEFLGYIGSCIDIEDRKHTEEALRESEERFRNLADNISQLAWMTDDTGWIFWYNQRWFDYTGTTLEQMQGWGWQQVHHPEHLDRVVAHFRQSFETGEPWEDTFPLRGNDGTYRWFLSRALPIRDETGRILRWFGTNTDITDRVRAEDDCKQAEEALRESESRLRLIFESAKDYAIFTLDLNGTIASWNPGAERLLGYTEAEAIGCPGQMVFTPEDNVQGRATYEMQTAIAQGRATNERWHIRRDGSRFWASGLMMPLLNEVGHPQGFVNIMQDMTAQRQANERLQLLYETASDLLSAEQPLMLMNSLISKLSGQMDLQFYVQYRIELADNHPILQLLLSNGIAQEAIQPIQQLEFGAGVCGWVAQEQHQIVVNEVQQSTLPNAQILRSLGVTAYASQPLIVQGRLIGTLAFGSFTRTHFTPEEAALLQAISDQVAVAIDRANLTASLRQQTEHLSQANRIKDEFLAVLSHELRTPLNPILGWSKLLRSKKHDEVTVNRALETIERNAQLQTQLIEDLLDVSRILQGKLSLNVTPVDLVFTLQAAMETVRLAAEAKSIQIQTAIEPDVGKVSGDANRLQQVVWNLLSNAVKFTPTGGRVEVKLESYEFSVLSSELTDSTQNSKLKTQNGFAQISVSDTGKGIAPEFLPYVFDYFRQADSATTRKFGGLGLGLAIVRQIVELHGGTVWVDSPGEGQGATFTVQIPLASRSIDLPTSKQMPETTIDLSGIRILVVDDEADSREFVAFVLEQANAIVTSVSSGIEALQFMDHSTLDLIVSDIGMPDMDGYMLMQHIRALDQGTVPAIAFTAYAGERDQQQALQAGFQIHLSKPIDPEQLIQAISTLRNSKGTIQVLEKSD